MKYNNDLICANQKLFCIVSIQFFMIIKLLKYKLVQWTHKIHTIAPEILLRVASLCTKKDYRSTICFVCCIAGNINNLRGCTLDVSPFFLFRDESGICVREGLCVFSDNESCL